MHACCGGEKHGWDRLEVERRWLPPTLRCFIFGENPGTLRPSTSISALQVTRRTKSRSAEPFFVDYISKASLPRRLSRDSRKRVFYSITPLGATCPPRSSAPRDKRRCGMRRAASGTPTIFAFGSPNRA